MCRLWHLHAAVALVVVCQLSYVALGQDFGVAASVCSRARSCGQCLEAGPACQWCSDLLEKYQVEPRCAVNFTTGCASVTNIHSEAPVFQRAEPLGSTVQLTPQLVTVSLRPGDSTTFKINLRRAPQYPLDVYYLMDHTVSFKPDLQTLARNARDIVETIKLTSSNARVGFGAFVDKPTQPYSVTQPQSGGRLSAITMCSSCSLPYVFENSLPLTNNTDEFVNALGSRSVSRSLDNPEGTLEAMMQVLACTQEIGWRENAHRVLIVATDNTYHTAGDGMLAGIAVPNDGQCYLDSSGQYSAWSEFDYPSVGQLNSKVQAQDISVVFAVKNRAKEVYEFVTSSISGAAQLELEANSENVGVLIDTSLRQLTAEARPSVLVEDGVRVSMISATCRLNIFDLILLGNGIEGCKNIDNSAIPVSFDITVRAGTCAELRGGGRATVRVPLYGDVEVQVTGMCDCPCINVSEVVNSTWCSSQGNEQCGVCSCLDGFENSALSRCDCDTRNKEKCREPTRSLICSGRGNCACEACVCDALSNGTYCECDNGNCELGDNGLLCSGSGDCVCGTCRCNEGFIGDSCDCAESDAGCRRSGPDSPLCSGQGECACGRCQCLSSYSGKFCETCIRTPELCMLEICQASEVCVELDAMAGNVSFQALVASTPRFAACSGFPRRLTSNVTLPYLIGGASSTLCTSIDKDSCTVTYYVAVQYASLPDNHVFMPLHIAKDRLCPVSSANSSSTFNYLPLSLGIVLGLLFVGIVSLLFWRYYTSKKDEQEYSEFINNQRDTDWSKTHNPLFKGATQKFENPLFHTMPEKRNGEGEFKELHPME